MSSAMALSSNIEELTARAHNFLSFRCKSFPTSISAGCRVIKRITTLPYF